MSKRVAGNTAVLKIVVYFFVMITFSALRPAFAEEQKLACADELAQYCKGVKPGGGRLLACLKEHQSDLSPACRDKVAGLESRLKEALQICATDIEHFCKGIQPGEGRIARCLDEHAQEISPDCMEKVHGIKKAIQDNKASGK